MVRILGTPIDLSQLPPLQLVSVNFEAELAALKAGIVARFQARGVPYNVQDIEADSAMVLAEEFAYRKTLSLQDLNDAGKRLTLASGYGAALDHVAATYYADIGVSRLALVASPRPYATNPEDWESDARFRTRIQLAPEVRTPGTLRSYEYFALTAAPHLIAARAFNYASGLCSPGQVLVVVLGQLPNPDPTLDVPGNDETAQLVLAQNALENRNTKLATDTVMVRVVSRTPVTASAVLGIPIGPDPSLIVSAATTALAAYAAECATTIGQIFTESGQKAAAFVGGVQRVRLVGAPADVDPGQDGVVQVTIGSVTTEPIGG